MKKIDLGQTIQILANEGVLTGRGGPTQTGRGSVTRSRKERAVGMVGRHKPSNVKYGLSDLRLAGKM